MKYETAELTGAGHGEEEMLVKEYKYPVRRRL